MKTILMAACGLCAAASSFAQEPQGAAALSDAVPMGDWRIPIHTQAAAVTGMSDVSGWWSVPFALPDSITAADLHWQFVQLDGASLRATQRLRTRIR